MHPASRPRHKPLGRRNSLAQRPAPGAPPLRVYLFGSHFVDGRKAARRGDSKRRKFAFLYDATNLGKLKQMGGTTINTCTSIDNRLSNERAASLKASGAKHADMSFTERRSSARLANREGAFEPWTQPELDVTEKEFKNQGVNAIKTLLRRKGSWT